MGLNSHSDSDSDEVLAPVKKEWMGDAVLFVSDYMNGLWGTRVGVGIRKSANPPLTHLFEAKWRSWNAVRP